MKKSEYTVSVNGGPAMDGNDFNNMLSKNLEKFKEESIPVSKSERITKAKITKESLLEVLIIETIIDDEGKRIYNEVSKKMGYMVHPDLAVAFNKLAFHAAIICDQIEVVNSPLVKVEDAKLLYNIHKLDLSVTGYSIGGEDEHEGITLIGRRELKSNKVLNLIAPFTKWSDEYNPYQFEGELYSDYQLAELEVIEYLNGKHAPSKQLEMEFEPI